MTLTRKLRNDLTGKRFGRLVVIEISGRNKRGRILWRVKCDCGKEKCMRGESLTYHKRPVLSCGCLRTEKLREFWKSDDTLHPFKWIKHCIKIRSNKHKEKTDVDEFFLRDLWNSQDGICPYTGIKMDLVQNSSKRKRGEMLPNQCSLDRIDSSKGYIKGNVEFVCLSINLAKNGFSKQQMLDFIKNIRYNKV